MKTSRIGLSVSAFPGVVMIGLFYSLAFHMHRSLGGWPTGIGERGFPRFLAVHAALATNYCIGFIVLSVFVVPVAALVCAVVPRWRGFLPYIGVYLVALAACWGAVHLAPTQYLDWWRD